MSKVDEYGRAGTVQRLAEIIDTIGVGAPSSVIGLAGPWGSGKSSVIRTLLELIHTRDSTPHWAVVDFNPWGYGSSEAMTLGFFAELRNALPDSAQWSQARGDLASLLRSVAPAGALTSLMGVDSTKVIESIADGLEGANPTSRARATASEALLGIGRPILVLIDDVDRLMPSELLNLFTLIRFLGRLPNVHYLMAYDESTLLDVLLQSSIVRDTHRAREYLEKIIQVRLDLPPIRDSQAEAVIDKHLEALMAQFDVIPDQGRLSDFAIIYHVHISVTVRTPRAIQRWFAHVRLLYPSLATEVDFIDFVVFVWLRLTHPGIPKMLQAHKAQLFPGASWQHLLADGLGSKTKAELAVRHGRWRTWTLESGVPESSVDEVLALLGRLFPTLDRVVKESSSEPDIRAVARRNGIGHPDYFERYFSLEVPNEELPESTFLSGIDAVAQGVPDQAEALRSALVADPRSILARVEDWLGATPSDTGPVILWLLSQSDAVSDEGLLSGRSALRGVVYRALHSQPEPTRVRILRDALGSDLHLNPIALAVNDLIREGDLDTNSEIVRETTAQIQTLVDKFNSPPEDCTREFWQLLWTWQAIDNEDLRAWYRKRATTPPWSLVSALAGIVSSATPVGVPNPKSHLRGLPASTIEAFLGTEWVRTNAREMELRPQSEIQTSDEFSGPEDTWPARLRVAESTLAGLIHS